MMKNELGIGEAAKTLFALANNGAEAEPRKARRQLAGATSMKTKSLLARLGVYLCASVTLGILLLMLGYILAKGIPYLDPSHEFPVMWRQWTFRHPSQRPALIG